MRLHVLSLIGLAVLAMLNSACATLDEADRATALPQVVLVEIRPNLYTIDGERVNRQKLETRLAQIAQDTTRSNRGGTKARIRLIMMPGANTSDRESLVDYCLSIGLDKIETPAVR